MTSFTIRIRKGDTAPLQYQLVTMDLQAQRLIPVDLTNKDVFFYMKSNYSGSVIVDGDPCEVIDQELAWVAYPFKKGETDAVTVHKIAFKTVDKTTGEVSTYPEPDDVSTLLLNIMENI